MRYLYTLILLFCATVLSAKNIYLNTGGASLWNQANAKFFVHSWNTNGDYVDVQMSHHEGDIYQVNIPDDYDYIIFLRMNPSATQVGWEEKEGLWNRTGDLLIPSNMNSYTISGWGDKDGYWGQYGISQDVNTSDTVFYLNTPYWNNVNVYAWNGETNNTWPGEQAHKATYRILDADVYYFVSYKNQYTYCIFNNGNEQTGDLFWTSGKYYCNGNWYTRTELEAMTNFPKPHYSSAVPSCCPDVMLQAFYWDSYQDKYYGNTRWATLLPQAEELSSYFDLVWLPPSALSSGGTGYIPKQFSNQNSDWGSHYELTQLIKTLQKGGTRVIADMIVNHIDGKDGWCSFYEQDFGRYGKFQVDGSYICNGDEMNFDPSAGGCQGKATGANDDGYGDESNYGAARDLAHDEEYVRQMCRAYAQWMIKEVGYDGFRYDYCKGFHMSHVDDYNANAGAYFSVIEYWDGNADVLWDRISDAKQNTLVFDFGMKYNVLNDGIAQFNYGKCKMPNCLIGRGKGKWAVNFIDNHDTFERGNGSDYGGDSMSENMKDRLLQANAFILSMPGVPCIFYPHWKKYSNELKVMIRARKAVGVHSESAVSDEAAGDGSGYRAYITGTNGTLILELGGWISESHWGFTNMIKGPGYAMWIKQDRIPASVEDAHTSTIPELNTSMPMYNILGQQVDETHTGIIIQNGHKYLRK